MTNQDQTIFSLLNKDPELRELRKGRAASMKEQQQCARLQNWRKEELIACQQRLKDAESDDERAKEEVDGVWVRERQRGGFFTAQLNARVAGLVMSRHDGGGKRERERVMEVRLGRVSVSMTVVC